MEKKNRRITREKKPFECPKSSLTGAIVFLTSQT
jgi:hypothetical protein